MCWNNYIISVLSSPASVKSELFTLMSSKLPAHDIILPEDKQLWE